MTNESFKLIADIIKRKYKHVNFWCLKKNRPIQSKLLRELAISLAKEIKKNNSIDAEQFLIDAGFGVNRWVGCDCEHLQTELPSNIKKELSSI